MGTREVYEEKLRTGNLHHDPTLNPGLGTPRCPRCLSLLDPNVEKGEWTITPVLHDATAVAGSGLGGMLSVVHGLNTGKLDSLWSWSGGNRCLLWNPYIKLPKLMEWATIPTKPSQGIQVAAFCCWAPSIANVFSCKCRIWRLCASEVHSTHCNIILCCLKCFTLWNLTSHQAY
ncbi:uncharacterized protein [Arachis hypogaea]|uniref:uncharacterized protein isoform X1 n=1 Tax=Arachis hypogaea TaxID=3818 RepID=UPI000DECC7B4|nr:uncharacterized protein LOC112750098 isoform X1 [Arachis hypogaea]